jgi:excisionase family DNA binding protein
LTLPAEQASSPEEAPSREDFRLSDRLALTVEEAAAAVGVSERHLRTMLAEIPHLRLGNRVVIPVKPFDEWLRKRAEQEANAIDQAVSEVLEKFDPEED